MKSNSFRNPNVVTNEVRRSCRAVDRVNEDLAARIEIYEGEISNLKEKLVKQGDYIKLGQALLKITNLNTVWALFDVYENQIDLFKKGQNITVTTNAFPNKKFMERVDFIDPTLNSATRTVKLRVVLNNTNRDLKTGMFAEASILHSSNKKEDVLMVPSTAVLWTGKRSVVYVKTNSVEPVFEMREITLRNQIGEQYEILDGLKNGDEIVTNGTFTIDAAAQLQGKKSMMNKKGGKTTTGHESHLTKEITEIKENKRLKVSSKFQLQLKGVFNNYIKLKDALVKDDSNNAVAEAKNISQSLSKVDMKLLKDEKAHTKWMSFQKEIKASSLSISNTSDIKIQRNYFIHLSKYLIQTIEIFGIQEKVYSQFCPMANTDKGAFWLSTEEKIRNPYFGNAMLSCGSVEQIIE